MTFVARAVAAVLVGGAPGCVADASRPPQRVDVAPVCVATPHVDVPVTKPVSQPSACWKNGRPHETVAAKGDDSSYCAAFDAAEVAKVEARIRKDFVVQSKPSKLVIDFGCDTASPAIEHAIFEDGSGHGGTLRIVDFERTTVGIRVRVIASSHYYNPNAVVRIGQMQTRDFDVLMAHARVALLAKPHLVIMTTPGKIGLGSFSMSSNDFHLRLRLVGAPDSRPVDRRFSGYDSSMNQEAILPMRLATEQIETALSTLPLVDQPAVTDDDKVLFTERFIATMQDVEQPTWWIAEHLVALAARFGTIDAVPVLVKVARRKGEPSADRTRPVALAAIAAITGWDPRYDENHRARSDDEATEAVVKECAITAP
jgi:hypothetical protein